MKLCKGCNIEYPPLQFGTHGYGTKCRQCRSKLERERRANTNATKEDNRPDCKNCGGKYTEHKTKSYGFCRRPECNEKRLEWVEANWDLLPPENTWRGRFESEFWEVTPEQKEHYATFFSLLRPQLPGKKRKCLKCREDLTSSKMQSRGARICAECHVKIAKIGALAVV